MKSTHFLVANIETLLDSLDRRITVRMFDEQGNMKIDFIENCDGCMFIPTKTGYLHVMTIDSTGFEGNGMEYQA